MKRVFLLILISVLYQPAARAAGYDSSCAAVQGLHVSNVKSASAVLQWEAVSKSVGYQYVVSKTVVPPDKFGLFSKDPIKEVTGLAAGTTYYAHVRSSCPGTSLSRWLTVQFNTPSTSDDHMGITPTFAVQLYPTDAQWSVTVKVKGSEEDTASVLLSDVLGRQLGNYTLKGDRLHVEVGSLPPGIYFLRYNDRKGRIQTQRITRVPY